MKFPVTIRHRQSRVKIYAPAKNFAYYRLCYAVAGKRRMQTFPNYSEAKTAGKRIVREIAQGSQAAALNATQSRDALAALERLAGLHKSTGRKFSLLGAVSEFAEAVAKLRGRSLGEAVPGYLRTVVTVKPKAVAEAVEEFIASRQHRAESQNGKRAQLSASYATHVNSWLREFAGTFPGTAVCDLSKEHLNAYMHAHTDVAAKNRNDRRATLKMFLNWAARNDYLPGHPRIVRFHAPTVEKTSDDVNPNKLALMGRCPGTDPDGQLHRRVGNSEPRIQCAGFFFGKRFFFAV